MICMDSKTTTTFTHERIDRQDIFLFFQWCFEVFPHCNHCPREAVKCKHVWGYGDSFCFHQFRKVHFAALYPIWDTQYNPLAHARGVSGPAPPTQSRRGWPSAYRALITFSLIIRALCGYGYSMRLIVTVPPASLACMVVRVVAPLPVHVACLM